MSDEVPLNLIGSLQSSKYVDISNQRTVNWYPVQFGPSAQAKNQQVLYPTPGLTTFCSPPGRYSRGGFVARTPTYNRCFVVVDTTLYEVFANQSYSSLGTLPNLAYGSTPCWFKCNGNNEVFIGHNSASNVFNMDTNTVTQITNANFPGSITSATYCDGYLFVVSGGFVYFSNANSCLNWTGSQVFHTTFRAAADVAVAAFRDKVFCLTYESIEPYYEDGSSTVWARFPGSILSTGLLGPRLLSVFDGGIVFVGMSEQGQAHVYLLSNEYNQLQPLSEHDPNIQWLLNQKQNELVDAWTEVQKTKDGGALLRLYVPSMKTCYCYNFLSGQWYEQRSYNPNPAADGSYELDMFRGIHCIPFAGFNLFQDLYSGTIFYEDYSNQTENGTFIKRKRTSATFNQGYKNIAISTLEIDATKGVGLASGQGSNPILMVSTSDDGGHTFSSPRNLPLGNFGNYLYRAREDNLGTSRNWTIDLELTDPLDLAIQNALANISVSNY